MKGEVKKKQEELVAMGEKWLDLEEEYKMAEKRGEEAGRRAEMSERRRKEQGEAVEKVQG